MIREDGDQGLLDASCAGDVDAFAKLYQKYQRDVYAVCLAVLNDPVLAEDAMQDTFLRAFLGLSRFKPGKPLGPWLRTIARRRCKDIRRRARDSSLEELIENGASLGLDGRDQFSDATLEKMITDETMAKLRQVLATMAPRQRRALLLSTLEGWSNADIASAEGVSLGAVSLLLVRARKKLRDTWESLGLVVAPWHNLRERLNAAINQTQRALYAEPDRWAVLGSQALLSAGLALCVCLFAQPGLPAKAGEPGSPVTVPAKDTLVKAVQTAAVAGRNLSPSPEGDQAQNQDQTGASGAAPLLGDLGIFPKEEEPTPENTSFYSIEPSPNYEQDHTVFAAGSTTASSSNCLNRFSYSCPVIFVSRDGGASWERLQGKGLKGNRLLVPPNYPIDNRIFMNDEHSVDGLQESLDGGKTFTTVSPFPGWAAISPGWGSGDRRILIAGGNALYEYLADEHRTNLVQLDLSKFNYLPPALAPLFPADPAFLMPASPNALLSTSASTLYVCSLDRCQPSALTDRVLEVAFSPHYARDRAVYVLSEKNVLRSTDMMKTYEQVDLSLNDNPGGFSWFNDMTLIPTGGSSPKLFLTTNDYSQAYDAKSTLYAVEDGIVSASVSLPLFHYGVRLVTTAPTGRLFAGGGQGIACSEDGGSSWKSRCLPEE